MVKAALLELKSQVVFLANGRSPMVEERFRASA
jgi:hypothetical protein